MTSNNKLIFLPGLNQAPDIFIDFRDKVQIITNSYNTNKICLEEDLDQIAKLIQNKGPMIIAHSLSALIIEWLIQNRGIIPHREILYIAPAFSDVSVFKRLLTLIPNRTPVPSLSPLRYRVNHLLSIRTYKKILELNSQVNIKLVACKVLVDKGDEMLNVKYINSSIDDVEVVSENRFPRHLCKNTLIKIFKNHLA